MASNLEFARMSAGQRHRDLENELRVRTAQHFLSALDDSASSFCFQTADERGRDKSLSRIIEGSVDEKWEDLVELNSRGAGIYVTINRTDGLGRKKSNVTKVRSVFLDLDGANLWSVFEFELEPHFVIETSPNHFHVYWLVDGLQNDDFAGVQRALASRFGGDGAVCDLPRSMRLPGTLNQKRDGFLVRVLRLGCPGLPYPGDRVLHEFLQHPVDDCEGYRKRANPPNDNVAHSRIDLARPLSGDEPWAEIETEIAPVIDAAHAHSFGGDVEPEEITAKLLKLADRDSGVRAIWQRLPSAHQRDGTPSGWDMSLANRLVRASWTNKEIAQALVAYRQEHGDPEKGRTDYYARTIHKARTGMNARAASVGRESADEHDKPHCGFELNNWTASRYSGNAPEIEWLIEDVLPLGVAGLIAGPSGIGKTFLALKLAAAVAIESKAHEHLFGGVVSASGTAVVLCAEERADEIHRRIEILDPARSRDRDPAKLIIVPTIEAGGPHCLIQETNNGVQTTREFYTLKKQLESVTGLRLVILDPLQLFVQGDMNRPLVSSFVGDALNRLATESGATVVAIHHMRKSPAGSKYQHLTGIEAAREAIRGSAALVERVRWAFAFWRPSPKDLRSACKALARSLEPDCIYLGATVMANGPRNSAIRTFVRNERSILVDWTESLSNHARKSPELEGILTSVIASAAATGHPFTKTGKRGLADRREELPDPLKTMGRDKLQRLAQDLVDDGRVVQCTGKDGIGWLDVPDGAIARKSGRSATPRKACRPKT